MLLDYDFEDSQTPDVGQCIPGTEEKLMSVGSRLDLVEPNGAAGKAWQFE